ncbi:putative cell wall binding repeat 2 [Novipirellula aureliae]|uniref:Putative cell wall binding repeat 2 n=1 Tax=Novipirellula aureliae TaxID=2527966 RepID=A0A5C6DS87_9BACT|nr:cell wall-binding repeat-containing protein [Novipirellula aureliae]TWU37916.1 putative cell wall binding repeat 2 [Novipirellula aureliae]
MKNYTHISAIICLLFTSGGVVQAESGETTRSGSFVTGKVNTLLVPMPLEEAGWQEFAYMAAVPAGRKINSDGMPSVVALPRDGAIDQYIGSNYMGRYNPDTIYSIGSTSGYEGVTNLDCSSLDDACCELARFWTTSKRVVLCSGDDYAKGLAASCLAGRLKAPLLFWGTDGSGLSSNVLESIDRLEAKSAILVGQNGTVQAQLSGVGVSNTILSDDKAVITWMTKNGLTPDYFAVVNPKDRDELTRGQKGSLAGALLASAREGAVVTLAYDTEYMTHFTGSETSDQPSGAVSSTKDWWTGSFTINGWTRNYAVGKPGSDWAGNIDWDQNGNYGDRGERVKRADIVTINGKRYSVDVTGAPRSLPGHIKFTYPCYEEVNEDLNKYYDLLGHHPKYMAIVGMPSVFPLGVARATEYGVIHGTDQFYSNVDSDGFHEIAIGRIVGGDASYITLNGSCCLTYDDLDKSGWANTMCHKTSEPDNEEFQNKWYSMPHRAENYGFNVYRMNDLEKSQWDWSNFSLYIQDQHGWPFMLGDEAGDKGMAPCLVEGGGCHMGSFDEEQWVIKNKKSWKDYTAIQCAYKGVAAFVAWSRGTPAGKDIGRTCFQNEILAGATLGEARLYLMNVMWYNQTMSWARYGTQCFGDPAMTFYRPQTTPKYKPAYVSGSDRTFTVHAPETYWVDHVKYCNRAKGSLYLHSAPGLATTPYEPDRMLSFFARYRTPHQVRNITQESVPSPLGWVARKGDNYQIDEHYDGTRTIWMKVRLDEFDNNQGTFIQKIDRINYSF